MFQNLENNKLKNKIAFKNRNYSKKVLNKIGKSLT